MSLARPRRRLNTSQRKAGVVKCQRKGENYGTFAGFVCVYIYIYINEVSLVVLISCSSFFLFNVQLKQYKPCQPHFFFGVPPPKAAASGTLPLVSIVLAQLASLSLAERVHGLFEAQPLPSTCHDGVLQLDGRPETKQVGGKAVSKKFSTRNGLL